MSKNTLFVLFTIGFLFGIFIGNILFHIKIIVCFLSFLLIFSLLLLWKMNKYHFFCIFTLFGIFLGLIYSSVYNSFISQKMSKISSYYQKEVFIEAEIGELYKKSSNFHTYRAKTISMNHKTESDFDFLLYSNTNISFSRGQIITFQAKIDPIENFSPTFEYVKFMQSKNIYFSVYKPNIISMHFRTLSAGERGVIFLRQKILDTISQIYPKNEAVFLGGLLIGAKENLSQELQTSFNNSGLTHIISVSGFNITIIIIFLGFLFQFFPLILRTFFIVCVILFFVLLVGDGVAVIRASIMGLVGYFIIISGRKADGLSLLLFTAFLMVLYNPFFLNYDISFHLSFLAVVGLLYFQNFWKNIFSFLPNFLAMKEGFVLTMSAMVTTLPIMIFNFGQVSVLAPIANMLVGGVIPFAMLFGFLSILGQMISEKIGFLIGFIDYFLLHFIIGVANFIGNLDFSVIKIDFGIYAVYIEILYFMILIFMILYFKQEKAHTL